jgi:hypothetical protein
MKLLMTVISTSIRTITGRGNINEYRKAKKTVEVSVGESVRIIRELQELSQNDLAELTGIQQSTISCEKCGLGPSGFEGITLSFNRAGQQTSEGFIETYRDLTGYKP